MIRLLHLVICVSNTVFGCDEKKDEIVKKEKKAGQIEWEDIGEEFKGAIFNLGRTLKNALEPNKKSSKKKAVEGKMQGKGWEMVEPKRTYEENVDTFQLIQKLMAQLKFQ